MPGTWALTLRSLRQDSRLLRFHLLRFAIAVVVVLGILAASESARVAEAPGRDLLEALGWANFWAVTIAGVLLFAPTITEEKEDQTLGLLRMTGIGPASLLLGKALPKLVQLLLVLIVQLPLVWLTRTLGGVDWLLMMNVYLLVFGQLIGVVAISMLASVVMRTSAGAVVAAGVLVFCWSLGPVIIEDQLRHIPNRRGLAVTYLHPGAIIAARMALSEKMNELLRSGGTVHGIPLAVGGNLVIAGLLSMLSVRSFHFWNQHETTETELEWGQQRLSLLGAWNSRRRESGTRTVSPRVEHVPLDGATTIALSLPRSGTSYVDDQPYRRGRRSYQSWSKAIEWKDYFLLGGGRTGFRIRCVLSSMWLVVFIHWVTETMQEILIDPQYVGGRDGRLQLGAEMILVCSAWAFGLDLVYLTVNLFSYELRRQTWESLQLLPLSLGTICRRKILGAACHLVPWVVAFLCGLAMSVSSDDMTYFWEYQMSDPLAVLGSVLQVVTQFVTALLVLTWLSLRFNPWIAILLTWAFYWVIGVAWIMSLFMVFGFMSPPGPYYQQVLFNVGWIGGISLLGWGLLRSIRSKLNGDAASV